MSAGLTSAAVALNDLVATLQALSTLYDKVKHRDPTDTEDRQLSQLENRREALEAQLQQLVREQLGVDYSVLWHAVTPTGPVPKL